MAWLGRLFDTPGSSTYHYREGDAYTQYSNVPHRSYEGWQGPSIFSEPRREEWASNVEEKPSDSNSSQPSYPSDIPLYSYNIPLNSYDEPSYSNDSSPYEIVAQSPTNTNDTRTYHNERVSYPQIDAESVEATNLAIALSLSEEEDRRRRSRDVPNTEDDESLARALQESIYLEQSAPRKIPAKPPGFRPVVQNPNRTNPCAGCKKPLGYGRFLSCLGKNWHPSCFACKLCSRPIAEREFSVQEGEPYHRDCYKELFHPKCEVCLQFIPTNAAGLIEYRSHPFWNQKYCPKHEADGTPRCCSCDRVETHDEQYVPLADGRKLCLECLETAVFDTKECQPLYREILKFYKNVGMMIDQEVPMLLVERSALNDAREGEKEGMHMTSETRGLCLSEEQTITTVFGGKPVFSRGPWSLWTEPRQLRRHCEVTAILVLYGLPRLLTGAILAHELMHAWLRLTGGFPHMSPEVEEGICQVMSHIWLSAELKRSQNRTSTNATSPAQERLGKFYLHQIANDTSPIYGNGFRRGLKAVNYHGLVRVLEHLRMTANFPPGP